jgi:hypothetical protein
MGISPNVWGPSAWAFIHLTAIAEPDNFDRARLVFYKQFFVLLQELLPCERCRIHLKQNMSKLKDIEKIQTKRELFDWTTDIHNKVNEITKKQKLSSDDAFDYWNSIASEKKPFKCSTKWFTFSWVSCLLLGLVLVCMMILLFVMLRKRQHLQKAQSRHP